MTGRDDIVQDYAVPARDWDTEEAKKVAIRAAKIAKWTEDKAAFDTYTTATLLAHNARHGAWAVKANARGKWQRDTDDHAKTVAAWWKNPDGDAPPASDVGPMPIDAGTAPVAPEVVSDPSECPEPCIASPMPLWLQQHKANKRKDATP